jgi:hypothetical protein
MTGHVVSLRNRILDILVRPLVLEFRLKQLKQSLPPSNADPPFAVPIALTPWYCAVFIHEVVSGRA